MKGGLKLDKNKFKEVVKDLLWVDPEIKNNEKLRIISTLQPISFYYDRKREYKIFNDFTYHYIINSGQHRLEFEIDSLEDMYLIYSYLIRKGWYRKIRIVQEKTYSNPPYKFDTYINPGLSISEINDNLKKGLEWWGKYETMPSITKRLLIQVDKGYGKYGILKFMKDMETLPEGYYFLWKEEHRSLSTEDNLKPGFSDLFIIKNYSKYVG